MNVVLLVGRLTRDPEARVTESGKAVTRLSVATNERSPDGTERTEYHTVVAWEKQAETVAKLTKGTTIAVQGRLQTRKWEDKEGRPRTTTEVIASRIDFVREKRTFVDEEPTQPIF